MKQQRQNSTTTWSISWLTFLFFAYKYQRKSILTFNIKSVPDVQWCCVHRSFFKMLLIRRFRHMRLWSIRQNIRLTKEQIFFTQQLPIISNALIPAFLHLLLQLQWSAAIADIISLFLKKNNVNCLETVVHPQNKADKILNLRNSFVPSAFTCL